MKISIKTIVGVGLLSAAWMAGGCATPLVPMVSFSPARPWDTRSPDQLLTDINKAMPFEISRGDFAAGKAIDGPSCWVCFSEPENTRTLLDVLGQTRDWRFRSIGYINPRYRHIFGLAPLPDSEPLSRRTLASR